MKRVGKMVEFVMSGCFNSVISYSEPVYAVRDDLNGPYSDWERNKFGLKDYVPEEFEIDGLKLYNDRRVLGNNEVIKNSTEITIRYGVEIDKEPNVFILNDVGNASVVFDKLFGRINQKLHVSQFTISNNLTGKKVRFDYNRLQDIFNKNNSNTVKKKMVELYNVLYQINRRKSGPFIDKYLNRSKYSSDIIELIRQIDIKNMTQVEIYEYDNSIRIVIPNGTKMKLYTSRAMEILKQFRDRGIYVFFEINGTLELKLPIYELQSLHIYEEYHNYFLRNYVAHNIENLIVKITNIQSSGVKLVDLSLHTVRNLKVYYGDINDCRWYGNQRYNWSSNGPDHSFTVPEFRFMNDCHPKIKVTDNSWRQIDVKDRPSNWMTLTKLV